MRLSDMIKNDSGGGEEKPKKKRSPQKAAPPARNPESAHDGEEPFRLSELPEIRKSLGTQVKKPAPPFEGADDEEERPFEPPEFFQDPMDLGETPAPFPQDAEPSGPFADPGPAFESDEPAVPERPKRPRKSVLMGPDSNRGSDDDTGESALFDLPPNPFAGLRERSLAFITQMFQSVNTGKAYPLSDAEDIIYECIEDPEAMEHLYSLAVSSKDSSNSLAVHLFNHTVYALKLGQGLRWPQDRIIRLGVASMIHDIGMCQISQHIRHKEGKLTPEEISEIHNHSKYGMEFVLKLYGEPFRWLAEAIYHEHEREDGQGYPQGLAGNQISEYGKVIGLADVYEALTHNRPQRKRLLPHKAVQEIVQTQKNQFHQKLLKIMLQELSVFSLNSLVRLNSNAIGRVTETIPGQPLRPVIQLLFDADGNEITDERLISLREFPLLYIVDEVEDSELPSP